jgi:hypothetical protein
MRNSASTISHRFICLTAAASCALLVAQAFGQTDVIQNGGFETVDPAVNGGDGTGALNWVQTSSAVTRVTTPANVFDGTAAEYLDNEIEASAVELYQNTAAVVPGSVYTLKFYSEGTLGPSAVAQYLIYYQDAQGNNLANSGYQNFNPSPSYAPTTLVLQAAPAGATQAQIHFFDVTGAVTGAFGRVYLDDVSLTTGSGGGGGGGSNTSGGVSAWNIPGSGDWNIGSNWTAGNPSGVGAEADLFGAITANHTIFTDIPITLGTLNFNNTNTYVVTGAGTLTMQASSGPANIIVQAGTQKINLPLTIASSTNVNVASGATLLVSNPVTINPGLTLASTGSGIVSYQSTVTVGNGGSFAMGSSTNASALTLQSNATATLSTSAAGNRKLLQLNSVSLGVASSLDLNNNDLIVHGGSLGTINGLVKTGYNAGGWNGTGIKSTSAATDSSHLTALGVIANTNSQGTALYGSGTVLGLFDGTSPAAGDVLVKYTYYGDTNLDGKVDGSDYSNLDNGYLGHKTGWANGDFNYDGTINGSDYTLMDNAFNTQGQPIASATAQLEGTSVPEPATLSLLSAGTLALLRRRSRRTDR